LSSEIDTFVASTDDLCAGGSRSDIEPRYIINGVYVAFDSDDCIPADPAAQKSAIVPRLLYRTARIICRDCSREFVFCAEEQKTVYEVEKRHPDYFPSRCPSCQSLHSRKRTLRQKYDASIESVLRSGSVADRRDMIATIDELQSLSGSMPDKIMQRRAQLVAALSAD
jgi:hypothetical protein